MRRVRLAKLVSFGVVAAVSVLTLQAAFAHVIGRMEVTGSSGGTSVAIGGSGGFGNNMYCGVPGHFTGGATAAATGGSISIVVAKDHTTRPDECRKLPSGEHLVKFMGGVHFVVDGTGAYVSPVEESGFAKWNEYPGYCRDQGAVIGTLMVDHNGDGSGSYALPSDLPLNGPGDAAVVCVYQVGVAALASFAPVAIVP